MAILVFRDANWPIERTAKLFNIQKRTIQRILDYAAEDKSDDYDFLPTMIYIDNRLLKAIKSLEIKSMDELKMRLLEIEEFKGIGDASMRRLKKYMNNESLAQARAQHFREEI